MSRLSGRLREVVVYERSDRRGPKFSSLAYGNCRGLPHASIKIIFSSHKNILSSNFKIKTVNAWVAPDNLTQYGERDKSRYSYNLNLLLLGCCLT